MVEVGVSGGVKTRMVGVLALVEQAILGVGRVRDRQRRLGWGGGVAALKTPEGPMISSLGLGGQRVFPAGSLVLCLRKKTCMGLEAVLKTGHAVMAVVGRMEVRVGVMTGVEVAAVRADGGHDEVVVAAADTKILLSYICNTLNSFTAALVLG